jgi:hypothetical protein
MENTEVTPVKETIEIETKVLWRIFFNLETREVQTYEIVQKWAGDIKMKEEPPHITVHAPGAELPANVPDSIRNAAAAFWSDKMEAYTEEYKVLAAAEVAKREVELAKVTALATKYEQLGGAVTDLHTKMQAASGAINIAVQALNDLQALTAKVNAGS